jgi:hypothetical protein
MGLSERLLVNVVNSFRFRDWLELGEGWCFKLFLQPAWSYGISDYDSL